jgi:predicted DNA-binding transcriptional regulator AlpA
MEKPDYRTNIEAINNLFPNRIALSATETAQILGCHVTTIYDAIKKEKNPLPAVRVKKKLIIPIEPLARWLCGY